jgi:uncharacterized protein YfaS (alpha-2-macroglobulin family)
VNGKAAGELEITAENSDIFHLVSLTPQVKSGANEILIDKKGQGTLAYQIVAVHHLPWEDRGPDIKGAPQQLLEIATEYSTTELKERDLLKVKVALRYHRPESAPMTLVDLGIPPGFEVNAESFEKLVKNGTVQRFESNGRQVTLYFDFIPGGGKPTEFEYRLTAKFPVKAKAPGAVAYQYYEPEVRDETEPVEITVGGLSL